MMNYCYANKDEFKLILCSSDGTKYENIIHDMAEIEVDATHKLQKQWNSSAIRNTMLTKHLSIYWQADCFRHFEVIIHDIPHENAAEYLEELKAFYTAGWKKLWDFNPYIFEYMLGLN